MKCPYCAEEIQDAAVKCKHCGEWLPAATWFHPATKTGSVPTKQALFNLEGGSVRVEPTNEGRVLVFQNADKIADIPKEQANNSNEVHLGSHTLIVQYKDPASVPLGLGIWFSGLRISVDGRPVEGTLDDPRTALRTARNALFLYAFVSLIGALISSDPDERLGGAILIPIFILSAIFAYKIPLLATLMGSAFGILDVSYFILSYGESGRHTGFGIVWFLIVRGGATLAMIRGLIAAVKLRSLRKKFAR